MNLYHWTTTACATSILQNGFQVQAPPRAELLFPSSQPVPAGEPAFLEWFWEHSLFGAACYFAEDVGVGSWREIITTRRRGIDTLITASVCGGLLDTRSLPPRAFTDYAHKGFDILGIPLSQRRAYMAARADFSCLYVTTIEQQRIGIVGSVVARGIRAEGYAGAIGMSLSHSQLLAEVAIWDISAIHDVRACALSHLSH